MKNSIKNNFKIYLSLTLLLPVIAFAEGQGTGNGAETVVCFKDVPTRTGIQARDHVVEVLRSNQYLPASQRVDVLDPLTLKQVTGVRLLDLYKASQDSLGGATETFVDIAGYDSLSSSQQVNALIDLIHKRLDLLKEKIAFFGDHMLHRINETMPLKNFKLSEGGVIELGDFSLMSILPVNCTIIQAAVQAREDGTAIAPSNLNVQYDFDRDDQISVTVAIDSRLYKLMPTTDRFALVMHELLYNYALTIGHITSDRTELLVPIVMSVDFPKMAGRELLTTLSSMNYGITETHYNKTELYTVTSGNEHFPYHVAEEDFIFKTEQDPPLTRGEHTISVELMVPAGSGVQLGSYGSFREIYSLKNQPIVVKSISCLGSCEGITHLKAGDQLLDYNGAIDSEYTLFQ
jgi:hypothetical protein